MIPDRPVVRWEGVDHEVVDIEKYYSGNKEDSYIKLKLRIPKRRVLVCWIVETNDNTMRGPFYSEQDAKDSAFNFGGHVRFMQEALFDAAKEEGK